MAFFQPNQSSPDGEFTTRVLVFEEPWGEVWRGERKDGHPIILVAYPTPEGDELFEESVDRLLKWKTCSEGTVAPYLMRVLQVSEGAIPYLMIDDPGGPTLRERMGELKAGEQLSLEEQGQLGLSICRGLVAGETYDLVPMGLTPDLVFKNTHDKENPWKLLPVAPGSRGQFSKLCGGRYFPPEIRGVLEPAKAHPDSYALGRLWGDVYRNDFTSDFPESPSEGVPYNGLRFILEMCFEKKDGIYSDANALSLAIDRWCRKALKEDVAEFRKRELARKRGPIITWLLEHGGVFKKLAITVVVLAALVGAGYGIMVSGFFDKPKSVLVSHDLLDLYMEDVLKGDSSRFEEYLTPSAFPQHNAMIDAINTMETKGVISPWNQYQTKSTGHGNTLLVRAMLMDSENKEFGVAHLRLHQRANARWIILSIHFEQKVYS